MSQIPAAPAIISRSVTHWSLNANEPLGGIRICVDVIPLILINAALAPSRFDTTTPLAKPL